MCVCKRASKVKTKTDPVYSYINFGVVGLVYKITEKCVYSKYDQNKFFSCAKKLALNVYNKKIKIKIKPN